MKFGKLYFVLVIGVFLGGCTSSSYQPLSKNTSSKKVEMKSSQKQEVSNPSLTVKVPDGANVYIMNIKPAYRDGIELERGKYDIKVVKKGYQTYRQWIVLSEDLTLDVKLEKSAQEEISVPAVNVVKANGYIEWSDTKKYNFDGAKLRYRKNLFWAKEMANYELTWHQAKSYCSRLSIKENGIIFNNFRLPEKDEFWSSFKTGYYVSEDLPKEMKNKYFFTNTAHKPYNKYDANMIYIIYVKSSNVDEYQRLKKDTKYRSGFGQSRVYAMCTTDEIKEDITVLAQQMFNEYQKQNQVLNLEKKPVQVAYPAFKKGEFETTEQFNLRVQKEKEKVDAQNIQNIKNWESKVEQQKEKHKGRLEYIQNNTESIYLEFLQKAMHIKYANPKITSVNYDADKQLFNIVIDSVKGNYHQNVQVPVKLQYAQKFKDLLSAKDFQPTVEFLVQNNKLLFQGIKEIKNPETLVEESEYKKAFNVKGKEESVVALKQFISKYPNSTFKALAQDRVEKLEAEIRVAKEKAAQERAKREVEAKEREKRAQAAKERKQASYYAKKSVGDKVCKDGTTALILSITITAYVENVNGNNIQLRIADTEGTTPYYNGVSLYKNTLIWDDYSSWYNCNY